MTLPGREIRVRGARFWVGAERREPSARLRRAGGDAGPEDVVVSFGRIGRDGKAAGETGTVRLDPVRKKAVVSFEKREEVVGAASAAEALERFLAAHLLAGRIILFP